MIASIFGIAESNGEPRSGDRIHRMERSVWIAPGGSTSAWTGPRDSVSVGAVFNGNSAGDGGWVLDERNGILCLLEGHATLRSGDRREGEPSRPLDAKDILEAYRKEGASCLNALEGSFNVAWWHRDQGRLVLANDRFGYRNLYVHEEGPRLVFGSRMAAVLEGIAGRPRIDVGALASSLYFKHSVGSRTLFEGVTILPPGSVLTWSGDSVSVERYWRIDQVEVEGGYDEARRARLEDALRASVRRAFPRSRRRFLGLTGGLDSRCLLAAAAAEGLAPPGLTDGVPSSTDLELARRAARHVGTSHEFYPTDPGRLGDWLPLMVRLQGATIPGFETHPCAFLVNGLDCDGLVIGMMGETARCGSTSPEHLGLSDRAAVVRAMDDRIRSRLGKDDGYPRLWHERYRDIGGSEPRERLERVLGAYEHDRDPAEIMEHFHVEMRGRRYLAKGPLIGGVAFPVAMPYLDVAWIEQVFSIPLPVRRSGRIQLDLLESLDASLRSLPFNREKKTYWTPAVAPKIRRRARKAGRRLRRRLGMGRHPGDPAPPYRYLEWSRSEMRGILRDLVYNPDAAHREYLDWAELGPRLEAHFRGAVDGRELIGALTVFELAHGLWIEPDRLPSAVRELPASRVAQAA